MNISWTRQLRAGLAVLLLGLPVLHAVAQEVTEDEDPPSRVARLSYRQGDVTLEPAGSSESETALLNRPLTTGDRLWVDANGRAELQSGSATLHLDESTGIEFTEVGDDSLRVLLHDGAVNVHVRDLGRDELIEIETPNTLITLDEPGEYRIEADMDGNATVVKVREGSSTVAGIERGSRDYTVDAGRQGLFTGTSPLSGEIDSIDPRTAFDRWSADREQKSARSPTTRYVSREVIGYEDLDDHGDWHSHPEYGYVWYPRVVVAGWAPYRYGQWVWVRPWGWTWVDSSPWGFAPFHYGRWVHVHDHWGWVPGPRRIRPVYAPALVAWVGGPSVSVSVSFGSGIGWFPLGPREVYVPGYRVSRRYVDRVNVSNTVIVNNTYITNVYNRGGRDVRYMHRDRPGSITAVSREDFTRGRPVDRHQIRWHDNDPGQVEANTLRPDGWRGDREERGGFATGRSDPRTRNRGNDLEDRSGRDERNRDDRNWVRGGVNNPREAAARDNFRRDPRRNEPSVGSDKRERTQVQRSNPERMDRPERRERFLPQQAVPQAESPRQSFREAPAYRDNPGARANPGFNGGGLSSGGQERRSEWGRGRQDPRSQGAQGSQPGQGSSQSNDEPRGRSLSQQGQKEGRQEVRGRGRGND